MARRTATKEAPVEKAPAKKSAEPAKGTAWLVDHVNESLGTSYTGYQLRILIRKLTKDGTLQRGEGRYEFKGPRDPQVLAIMKAVKAGGVKEAQTSRVEKAKEAAQAPSKRRSRRAADGSAESDPEEGTMKPARRTRRKPAVEVDDDDIDLDEI